ncbi:hypothetical protein CTI14_45725, partial [Methylobacterium radiotolerans]
EQQADRVRVLLGVVRGAHGDAAQQPRERLDLGGRRDRVEATASAVETSSSSSMAPSLAPLGTGT